MISSYSHERSPAGDLKIAFVTTFGSAEMGGAGRVAHELAAASARTHQVMLVCLGERASVSESRPGEPTIVRLAARGESDLLLPDLRARHHLHALLADFAPDVVHAHDFSPLALCLQDWARRNRRPFFVTLHCLPSQAQAFSSVDKSALTRWLGNSGLFRLFITLYLRRCSGVIALNGAMEEDLRRFGYRGPIYVVPNGRDLGAYSGLPEADLGHIEKRLLFVGVLAQRKNQRYLVEMTEHLDVPARLVLVGEPTEREYVEELRSYIASRRLQAVDIVGAVSFAAIPRYLQSAHVFVSASRLEVQSLSVIEALASGTPVVGLSNQTVDELVDDSVGRRLPGDAAPGQFARAVSEVCSLPPEDYAAMCRAARAQVQDLDWQAVVEKTQTVYEDLIAQRARSVARRGWGLSWTPWLVAASSLRYGWHDLMNPAKVRRERRRPAWMGGTDRHTR